MIVFTPYPIPVVTEIGDGYLLYIQSSQQFENDIWTCVLCNGGEVKHFNTSQIKIFKNPTFEIYERKANKKVKENGKTVLSKPTTKRKNKNTRTNISGIKKHT